MRIRTVIVLVMIAAVVAGVLSCRKKEPLRIGFVGGLSGRVADLGVAGRNGAQLAIEQSNAAGGINGRQVELVVRDDEQNPDTAKRVVAELISRDIELIIGPMTSSMAMAVMPQVNATKSIFVSPTVSTTELSGKDDNFLRVIATTADYAAKNARYQFEKLGIHTLAAIYDKNNAAYSESWLRDFSKTFEALGGRVVLVRSFVSGRDTVFQPLVKELLAAGADGLLIIGNSVDSAMICQQVRRIAPKQHISLSDWAATERFIELAGPSADGVIVSQLIDRNNSSTRYRDFLTAYRERYKQEPGFAGIAGYDAALVALEALKIRRNGESLKQTILARKTFQAVQQQLTFDRFGDADRKTYATAIRDGKYVTVE